MNNLYRHSLKYDVYYIELEKTPGHTRVWDIRNEGMLHKELIIDLPGDWTEKQVQELIHVTQLTAEWFHMEGRKSKQDEIKKVLGV